MFSKQVDTSAKGKAPVTFQNETPAPAPAKAPSLSVIGEGVTVTGDIVGQGELQLDCQVRGDIRVDKLVVGPKGRVEGSVFARVAEVRGRVVGAIVAQQVRIYSSGVVEGDVTHEQLAMETGADFQGRSLKFKRPEASAERAAPAQTPYPTPALTS